MAGSAFLKAWRKRDVMIGTTKEQARYWFKLGMSELQRIQSENKSKHPGVAEVMQFEADTQRLSGALGAKGEL